MVPLAETFATHYLSMSKPATVAGESTVTIPSSGHSDSTSPKIESETTRSHTQSSDDQSPCKNDFIYVVLEICMI